jgi:hypothetical protein
MESKIILRSGVLFLVIALVIGSFGVIILAKNNVTKGGWCGGMQQRNQTQIQECEKECNENCARECTVECTGECDGNQVQVSGAELKAMKISDLAKLWEIDASTLLNKIITTFNLKQTYTIENTLNDLRGEYRFSPFQIKDIANKLKVI